MARLLGIPRFDSSRVGAPFNLKKQMLVYQPETSDDEIAQVLAVIGAMKGRSLLLLNSLADVQRYRSALKLSLKSLFEGDADRGSMLQEFRKDIASVLVGVNFWEGVDVPGESLSCVVIARLPFPAHDPLIQERRQQAAARGEDPFLAVDLPEMLIKLKQGIGRLIRAEQDQGVLALLDLSYKDQPWRQMVERVLPEEAEVTSDLERVASFCP